MNTNNVLQESNNKTSKTVILDLKILCTLELMLFGNTKYFKSTNIYLKVKFIGLELGC